MTTNLPVVRKVTQTHVKQRPLFKTNIFHSSPLKKNQNQQQKTAEKKPERTTTTKKIINTALIHFALTLIKNRWFWLIWQHCKKELFNYVEDELKLIRFNYRKHVYSTYVSLLPHKLFYFLTIMKNIKTVTLAETILLWSQLCVFHSTEKTGVTVLSKDRQEKSAILMRQNSVCLMLLASPKKIFLLNFRHLHQPLLFFFNGSLFFWSSFPLVEETISEKHF